MSVAQIEAGRKGEEAVSLSVPLITSLEGQSILGIKASKGFIINTSISTGILKQNSNIVDKITKLDYASLSWLRANNSIALRSTAGFWRGQIEESRSKIEKEIGETKLSPVAENEIKNAYDSLCQKVGEGNIHVLAYDPNENNDQLIFADQSRAQGEGEIIEIIKERFVSQFSPEAIEGRNEKRLKLAQESLSKNKNQTVSRVLAESKNLSHIESGLKIVVWAADKG